MNPQTIAHLASKYNVRPETIVRLHNLSLTINHEGTGELAKGQAQRAYDRIVQAECHGVDPLV